MPRSLVADKQGCSSGGNKGSHSKTQTEACAVSRGVIAGIRVSQQVCPARLKLVCEVSGCCWVWMWFGCGETMLGMQVGIGWAVNVGDVEGEEGAVEAGGG